MGGSSPPFLYGPPSTYNFHGPTDPGFDPKAVTRASWTRPPPKPKPKGPLVNFNRHPDSYSNIPNGISRWTPMSPHTKSKVVYGRKVQLALRILAFIGAFGSLFCAIVVKNVPATIVWVIRVAPGVAILHGFYGIYHLFRSPIGRPAGSQASYMLFAFIMDLGLIPFYVFSAYLGYMQYVNSAYNWSTMLGSEIDVVTKIAQAMFLLSVINGGLHLITLGICVFLGFIFREIAKLPPDLNPLEDNLTARRHKRTKSELAEKHASQSTLDSAMSEDPLIGTPRQMAFMHTRAQSSEGGSNRFSTDFTGNRQSQGSLQYENSRPFLPPMTFNHQVDPADDLLYQIPEDNTDIFTKPTSTIPHRTPTREPSPEVPSRSQCVSPESGNWVAFSSRATSLADNDMGRREPSSVYSRGNTPASTKGNMMDWVAPGARLGYEREPIHEDRGEYETLPVHEYYGNDEEDQNYRRQNELYDSIEQDIGDNRISIFQDYDDRRESSEDLHVNPLAMNPPTPQPILDDIIHETPAKGRMALVDIPNLTPTPPTMVPPLDNREKTRFYGELPSNSDVEISRKVSERQREPESRLGRTKSKLVKKASQKKNSYGALKQHDDVIMDGENIAAKSPNLETSEGDRKGRVVSNSGADLSSQLGTGSSLSYGKYIAGLGVGRRRDVSGKLAEEGRVNTPPTSQNSTPRAAGWARFAGL